MSKHLCMLFAIMIQWNGTRLFASKTGRTFLVNMVLPKVRGESEGSRLRGLLATCNSELLVCATVQLEKSTVSPEANWWTLGQELALQPNLPHRDKAEEGHSNFLRGKAKGWDTHVIWFLPGSFITVVPHEPDLHFPVGKQNCHKMHVPSFGRLRDLMTGFLWFLQK